MSNTEAPTKSDYMDGLIEAITILNGALSEMADVDDHGGSSADISDIAERAMSEAHTAYRKAIGAHAGCDESGCVGREDRISAG